jgi:hypothetical protein
VNFCVVLRIFREFCEFLCSVYNFYNFSHIIMNFASVANCVDVLMLATLDLTFGNTALFEKRQN